MMISTLRKKYPSSIFTLRHFTLFRLVLGILLSAHILLHLRHSHVLTSAGQKHAPGDDGFDSNRTPPSSRLEAAANLVGSLLPRVIERAQPDSAKAGSDGRVGFGTLLSSVLVGRTANASGEEDGKGQQELGLIRWGGEKQSQTLEAGAGRPEVTKLNLGPRQEEPVEASAGTARVVLEEGDVGRSSKAQQQVLSREGGAIERGTDPPPDPLMGVLSLEDNQELEKSEGTLDSETYLAELKSAKVSREGSSAGGEGEGSRTKSSEGSSADKGVNDVSSEEERKTESVSQKEGEKVETEVDGESEGQKRGERGFVPVEELERKGDAESELPVERAELLPESGETGDSQTRTGEEDSDQTGPESGTTRGGGEEANTWDDVRDPERRRALLQRKIDAQLAPYRKGSFTYADVAAQKSRNVMSTHFILKPDNITLLKDPDELSDNWSYWFRADQVRQIFQLLIDQKRIPDHVEIVVNIQASPRLNRSENPPDLPPVLSYCSTPDHYDLIGVGYQYHRCLMKEEYQDGEMCHGSWDPDAIRREHPWGDRKGTALWRGSPTGGLYRIEDWKEKERSKLVFMSKAHPEVLDAMFTPCSDGQCTVDGAAAIGDELGYADRLANFTDYVQHKYLVDIDGESWSSRFFQLLASGATVFKQSTRYREFSDFFFTDGTHYVRYAKDLGDLLPLLQGAESRQEELRAIGERSLALVEHLVTNDVILEYLGMLLTSYAELFAPEGGASES